MQQPNLENGIRILNQDLWETIISFIISANNNIPRIKGIIERISRKYGNEIEWNGEKYYTFPTPQELKNATVEDLRSLGTGFRDIRIYETTHKILNGEFKTYNTKNILINGIKLIYVLDSKGFYVPVYEFDANADGYNLVIRISAIKKL